MTTPVEEAVARGAAEIDRVQGTEPPFGTPAWWFQVDLSTLDMRSLDYCVLGQLYGSLFVGYEALWPESTKGPGTGPDTEMFGFNLRGWGLTPDTWNFSDLTAAWVKEINRRRVASQEATVS